MSTTTVIMYTSVFVQTYFLQALQVGLDVSKFRPMSIISPIFHQCNL